MNLTRHGKASGQTWPWIGQSRLGAALLTMLDNNTWPATVLFRGPEHLGKATVARWLAQRDLCQESNKPCGRCADCQAVVAGRHADCYFLAPTASSAIKTDEVSQALHGLIWKRPTADQRRRWVVITDIDLLSEHLGNTLLKLIEEPPVGTVILLTSSQPDRVLPTILSRCVHYRWPAASRTELDEALEQRLPTSTMTQRQAIVAQADGRPGRVVVMADQPELYEQEWAMTVELMQSLVSGQLPDRADITVADLDRCEQLIRDALIVSATGTARTWPGRTAELSRLVAQLGQVRLQQMAERLTRRQPYLTQHVQPSFFLHDLIF